MKEAGALIREFAGKGLKIATAESCTGGLIAASLTDIPGSSDVFERGFVTYSNESKTELLGIPASLIAEHGAVSEQVARAMSAGALAHSPADVAIAVTGIAGPGGGTAEKPVGLVYVAAAQRGGGQSVQRHLFDGDRESVRLSTVRAALALALSLVAS
jgi:nicotinamide-nucleotide amidase